MITQYRPTLNLIPEEGIPTAEYADMYISKHDMAHGKIRFN